MVAKSLDVGWKRMSLRSPPTPRPGVGYHQYRARSVVEMVLTDPTTTRTRFRYTYPCEPTTTRSWRRRFGPSRAPVRRLERRGNTLPFGLVVHPPRADSTPPTVETAPRADGASIRLRKGIIVASGARGGGSAGRAGDTCHPAGEFDIATAEVPERRLAPVIARGEDVVIDIEKLDFIEVVVGLRILADAGERLKVQGARLALGKPRPLVPRVVDILELNEWIDVS